MTLRTPTPTRPWSLPQLGHVLRACAGVRGKHRQLGHAVLQMALLEHACTDDPPRAAGLVERVANGSKKAAAEITALLDAHHQLVQAPPAAPPPLAAQPSHSPHLPARQSLEPCPRGTERHRISHWIAAGLLDPEALGFTAATIASPAAAAYRRLFGDRLPARDPTHRASRVYTHREITVVADNIRPRK